MSTTPARQPKGRPTGGQFAANSNPESALELEDHPNWGVCRSDVGGRSPWGTIDNVEHLAPGIVRVDTASHGGIHLSKERNAAVHLAWRDADGWYEEDCEWAIPAFTFPEAFPDISEETSDSTLRRWFPDQYEQVTGAHLLPGESYVRDEQLFFAEHENDMVGISAISSATQPGMVDVTARRGGRGPNARGEVRDYLVPKDVYDQRGSYGFVVDDAMGQGA